MKVSIAGMAVQIFILFFSLIVLPIYFMSIIQYYKDVNRIQTAERNFVDYVIDNRQVSDAAMSELNLSIAAVLWIGASGTIEVGAISASITYMTMTLMSLMMLSMIFMNFSRAKASTERILEILNEKPDVSNKENCITKEISAGEVEFNVDEFAFKDSQGEAILTNIKCKINPGEMVAIIGSTGTGKSTMVNLIPRFYDVTKGSVKIDGIDTRDYDLITLRDSIGMVLQENRLFAGTIAENMRKRECFLYAAKQEKV